MHTGRGLGSLLTAASLYLSLAHGVTSSHLCVGREQEAASRLYQRSFGFAPLLGAKVGGYMTDLELKDVKRSMNFYIKDLTKQK